MGISDFGTFETDTEAVAVLGLDNISAFENSMYRQ